MCVSLVCGYGTTDIRLLLLWLRFLFAGWEIRFLLSRKDMGNLRLPNGGRDRDKYRNCPTGPLSVWDFGTTRRGHEEVGGRLSSLYMLCANLSTADGAVITIGSEIARRGHCLCEVSERSNGISRRSVDDLLLWFKEIEFKSLVINPMVDETE